MADRKSRRRRPNELDDEIVIDTDAASPARLLNYLAGGDDHFAADRAAAGEMSDALPGGLDAARTAVRSLGRFVGRAVHYLADEQGIRQFLDIGTGLPVTKTTHELVQRTAPEARYVYVADDPVILAHAHALRRSTPGGAAAYVHAKLNPPDKLLRLAAETLDFDQPIAVLCPATLNVVADEDRPVEIIARIMEAVPSGSYLCLAHASLDIGDAGMAEAAKRLNQSLGRAYVVRSRDEILRFFDRLEIQDPGLVQIDHWRPRETPPDATGTRPTPVFVAVARKP